MTKLQNKTKKEVKLEITKTQSSGIPIFYTNSDDKRFDDDAHYEKKDFKIETIIYKISK